MFYDNLLELCRRNSLVPSVVAKDLGFSSSMPTAWKRGTVPKADTIKKIAEYFHVTTDELLNDLPTQPESKLHSEKGVKVAVLSSVGAGIPMEAIVTFDENDPDSWEEISTLEASKGRYFALRVRGNSMEPLIQYGDIVIVRIDEEYHDGDFVVALVNGNEGMCKQLEYRNHGIALMSMNPAYPVQEYSDEQIRDIPVKIMGRITEVRHRL